MSDEKSELAGQALESLVSQFSSAMDCLRELVQNSMDAGTPEVDVWMDFEPPESGQPSGEGVISVHVDDFGSGMDEAIIDGELTRLFASSKEGDLTKIGKFGIGFVSIFALGPEVVLLHTGRGGQYWEVQFLADRSFTKTQVTTPVEGTQITLFLSGDESRYLELVREARATLKRWCRHSDVEITFEDRSGLSATAQGESGRQDGRAGAGTGADAGVGFGAGPERVNEPFELPGLVSAEVERDGTRMVLAYAHRPTWSFFNKGLTLAELTDPDEVPERFAGVSFKIKSRYLEHTLSRETVLRDENFAKAMRLLEDAANGPLHDSLLVALETLVAEPRWGLAEEDRYEQLASFLVREPRDAIRAARSRPILRTVDGAATSLSDVGKALGQSGWIFVSDAATGLAADLQSEGVPVLFSRFVPEPPEARSAPCDSGANGTDGTGGNAPRPQARPPAALRLVLAFAAEAERERPWRRLLSVFTEKDYGAEVSSRLTRPEEVFWALDVDETLPEEDALLIGRAEKLLEEVGAGYRRLGGGTLVAQPRQPPLFLVAQRVSHRMAVPGPVAPAGKRPKRPEAVVNREHPHYRALVTLQRRAPGLAAYGLAKSLLLSEDRLLGRDLELRGRALAEIDGAPCDWRVT